MGYGGAQPDGEVGVVLLGESRQTIEELTYVVGAIPMLLLLKIALNGVVLTDKTGIDKFREVNLRFAQLVEVLPLRAYNNTIERHSGEDFPRLFASLRLLESFFGYVLYLSAQHVATEIVISVKKLLGYAHVVLRIKFNF